MQFTLQEIEKAAEIVYAELDPTPQICWPMLCEKFGTEVWTKHENQTPVGAFKIRGGLVYFSKLLEQGPPPAGVISATRGNHGQSIGYAARYYGIPATIVVPHGNSVEKNKAMLKLGVTLLEHGEDFQSAREYAEALAKEEGLHMIPSFHPWLVAGVASYSLEFLREVPDLDRVYVPIGLGSGICGMMAARDTLGLDTEIIGVVSSHARAYAESFRSGALVDSPATTQLADGIACRVPDPDALDLIRQGVSRIIEVSDDDIADAIRLMHACTQTICEGAGVASAAAAWQERDQLQHRKIGIILSGGNIDSHVFDSVLAGDTAPGLPQ
jgi:threonine dehydratase